MVLLHMSGDSNQNRLFEDSDGLLSYLWVSR